MKNHIFTQMDFGAAYAAERKEKMEKYSLPELEVFTLSASWLQTSNETEPDVVNV